MSIDPSPPPPIYQPRGEREYLNGLLIAVCPKCRHFVNLPRESSHNPAQARPPALAAPTAPEDEDDIDPRFVGFRPEAPRQRRKKSRMGTSLLVCLVIIGGAIAFGRGRTQEIGTHQQVEQPVRDVTPSPPVVKHLESEPVHDVMPPPPRVEPAEPMVEHVEVANVEHPSPPAVEHLEPAEPPITTFQVADSVLKQKALDRLAVLVTNTHEITKITGPQPLVLGGGKFSPWRGPSGVEFYKGMKGVRIEYKVRNERLIWREDQRLFCFDTDGQLVETPTMDTKGIRTCPGCRALPSPATVCLEEEKKDVIAEWEKLTPLWMREAGRK